MNLCEVVGSVVERLDALVGKGQLTFFSLLISCAPVVHESGWPMFCCSGLARSGH